MKSVGTRDLRRSLDSCFKVKRVKLEIHVTNLESPALLRLGGGRFGVTSVCVCEIARAISQSHEIFRAATAESFVY